MDFVTEPEVWASSVQTDVVHLREVHAVSSALWTTPRRLDDLARARSWRDKGEIFDDPGCVRLLDIDYADAGIQEGGDGVTVDGDFSRVRGEIEDAENASPRKTDGKAIGIRVSAMSNAPRCP